MFEFSLLVLGLAGLWAGSEVLIRGAMSLADRFRVSDMFIGMLILAVGTDLPELFVAFDASAHKLTEAGYEGIIIGSAIGSAIGQFALVFGVAGFIGFAPRPLRLATRNSVFLLGGLVALTVFSLDGVISRFEGAVLIALYMGYLWTLFVWPAIGMEEFAPEPTHPLSKDVFYLLVGLGILLISAELTVVYAARVATLVGLSNYAVSALIIGLGSSLPELCVSLVALFKNRGGLTVGNLLGSNVLDTLLVPGVGAALAPLMVPAGVLVLDLPVQALVTLLVLGFLYVSPRGVKAPEASILLMIYACYFWLRLTA